MGLMVKSKEAILFFAGVLAVLFFQLGDMFREGHYLYLAVVEDPASILSLYPWDVFSARSLRLGFFPLWNHLSGTGMPHLANLQSSVLNPMKWPFFAWPSLRVLDVMVVIRIALSGTFTYLFARAIGLSRISAVPAGLAFAFSGYVMKHMNQVSLASEMWLPALLLLIFLQSRKAGLRYFVLSSVLFALVFCGGNPEAAFYVSLLALFYAVFLGAGKRPLPSWLVLGFAGPFVAGAVLASLQLVPFIEYLGAGWHIHDPGLHQVGAHSPRYITTLVAPWIAGMKGQGRQLLLVAPYVGASVLFLAMLGASQPYRTRHSMFFTAGVAVLLALVYNSPPLGFLSHVPPFDRSGNAKFAMAGVSLFVALLSGHGVENLLRGTYSGKRAAPALAVVSILVLGGGAFSLLRLNAFSLTGFLVPFLSLAVTGFVLLFRQRLGKSARPGRWAAVVAAVCVFELLMCFQGYDISSAYDPARVRYHKPAPPPELAPVITDRGHPRFTGTARDPKGNYHHHSLNLLYNVCDIRVFEAMYPRSYVEAMAEIEGFSMDKAVANFFSHGWSFDIERKNLEHPLVDRLGVSYVISDKEVTARGFELMQKSGFLVYKNRQAFPRVFFEGEGAGADRANITDYSGERVMVRAEGPGRLVLADTGFPGWRAVSGDKELKMASGFLRSVELGEGRHRIGFTYEPWGFRLGLWMSLSALAALVVFAAMIVKFKKRAEKKDTEVMP
ncbi:MAG: hypothetical protein R6V10_01070 [bacterium]